ncbi:hypothetical protein AAFF_G00055770 [Aldrovandia affinis]|uniref:Uncharacterized protein n=1 Tax=Aldrovandia affinis TaxID=143900 RepID=A0AAD7S0V5_9TELE|nr:hypothetical protein AAFF_G00055770 [Aldrovandia affinis]
MALHESTAWLSSYWKQKEPCVSSAAPLQVHTEVKAQLSFSVTPEGIARAAHWEALGKWAVTQCGCGAGLVLHADPCSTLTRGQVAAGLHTGHSQLGPVFAFHDSEESERAQSGRGRAGTLGLNRYSHRPRPGILSDGGRRHECSALHHSFSLRGRGCFHTEPNSPEEEREQCHCGLGDIDVRSAARRESCRSLPSRNT